MTDTFSRFPKPNFRTIIAVIGVVCLLIVPTGAVVFNGLDLVGPEEDLALQPHDGPNGAYAVLDAERQLTINVTDAGVNPNSRTDIKRVFIITNLGNDTKQIWLTQTNRHSVTFYDDSTGWSITESDNTTLRPDEQVVVSLRVDTTDPSVNAGDTLVTKLYIHTRTLGGSRPAVDAPASVELGNVTVGAATTTEVVLNNVGNESLEFSNFTTVGPDSNSFSLDNDDFRSVSPGESTSVTVGFAPSTSGSKSAALEADTNDPETPRLRILLSGTGEPPALTILDTPAIDFGSVNTGTTATESITVRNDGSESVTIDSIAVTGERTGDFAVGGTDLPIRLSPGETRAFTVTFAPTSTGSVEGTLVVGVEDTETDAPGVPVLGRGDRTEIRIDPSAVNFGGVGIGTSANATVAITSTGTVPIAVNDLGFGGANPDQFSVETDGVPPSLQPGETALITVRFEPTQAGNFSAVLTVDTNTTDTPTTTLPVEGSGLSPRIGVGEDNLDFGNVTVGSSKTLNVTVWNEEDSPAELEVRRTFIVGADPEVFAITGGNAPFTLRPGETKDIEVTYNPDTPGIKTAQLQILSDAGNSPQINVWMSNTGWRIRVQQVAPKSGGVDDDDEEYSLNPALINDDSIRVEVDANDIPEGMWLDINVSQPDTRASPAGTDVIRLRTQRAGSFDMNFIHSRTPPTADALSYSPSTGKDVVQYVTLWHSVPNEDFSSPSLQYRVRKSSLQRDVLPEDVVFRRYADGEWNRHEATLLRETAQHYVYRVELPGLSQFVITAPNGDDSESTADGPGGENGVGEGENTKVETQAAPDGQDSTTPTVEQGNVSITFDGSGDDTNLQQNVSVRELPVLSPGGDERDGPQATIAAGVDADSSIESAATDEQIAERIRASGADAVTIVNEPIPLTGSHSLFSSKGSIDDSWRMIRRVELTVPPEYEDRPATVRLRVPLERFHSTDLEDARIARQHGGWQLLETEVVDRTGDAVILEADTPGFSIFAVFADNDVSYTWHVETVPEAMSGITVEPTFADIGIYNVTLTVTDSFGLTNTARYRVLANDNPKVAIERASPAILNESTTLIATVDDELGNVTLTWTFPDGSEATGRTVNYTFGSGVQTVRVVAEDEFGARATAEQRFVVEEFSGINVDSVVRMLSFDGRVVLLALLLIAFAFLVWRNRRIAALLLGHPPKITYLDEPRFESENGRIIVPALETVDRGVDLRDFEVSLLDRDERVLATGSGSIDGGREFTASSVVLQTATDTRFDRDESYALRVVVTDEAGNETTEVSPLPVDPFVYPPSESLR